MEEPEDEAILANFREARRALDQARTSRGFYPVRNPNAPRPDGKGYGRGFGKGGADHSEIACVRRGKKGHIARNCPQRAGNAKGRGKNGAVNFVGWMVSVHDEELQDDDDDNHPLGPWDLEENLDDMYREEVTPASAFVVSSVAPPDNDVGTILKTNGGEDVFLAHGPKKGMAIIDSGASENIIGEDTLQDLAECLRELEFDPMEEIEVDRNIHKQFTYGNNLTSAGLGLTHVNAGICGQEVPVQAHMVEGATPFLLSAKFLYDLDATINFRKGIAVFRKLSEQQIKLERSSSNHLLLPMTAFAGRSEVLQALAVDQTDPTVELLSSCAKDNLHVQTGEPEKGDPVEPTRAPSKA